MLSSAEEFVKLRNSEDHSERLRAAHDSAPMHVWFDVLSKFPAMRGWVAHNKTVPIEVLAILAMDPDADVRFTVAAKRKLNLQLFDTLAKDPDESVRARVARNAKVPRHVLHQLLSDPWLLVASAASSRCDV